MINLGIMGSIAASAAPSDNSIFTFDTWTDKNNTKQGMSLENRADVSPWDVEPIGSIIRGFNIESGGVEYELMVFESMLLSSTQWATGTGFNWPRLCFKRVDRVVPLTVDFNNINNWFANNQITIYPDNGDSDDRFYGDSIGALLSSSSLSETFIGSTDEFTGGFPPSNLLETYAIRRVKQHTHIKNVLNMTLAIHTHWHQSVLTAGTDVIIEVL